MVCETCVGCKKLSTQKKRKRDKDNLEDHKPTQNAFIESFNGKLRDECLNETLFGSLTEAKETLEEWQEDYNWQRSHSALGNLTPMEFSKKMSMDKMAA